MLRLAVLSLVGAVSAVGAAQAVAAFAPSNHAASLTLTQPQPVAAQTDGSAASIAKAADGHYWAQASVNGTAVKVLVDTGASTVALFEPTRMVWPSGAERTTSIVPMEPEPPALFSARNGWPNLSFMYSI